jgi:RHO1 GDP-GTP exchange protein 1/2
MWRLDAFITDVFHNYTQLLVCHRRLLKKLHRVQQEQHPILNSITSTLKDAFLDLEWRNAHREYLSNYPIAAYCIAEELARNEAFKVFHAVSID